MKKEYRDSFSRRAHLVAFLVALLACIVVVVWMAGPYLLPLFLGGTLAMLAYPFFQRLRARRWGPRLAAVSVTSLLLLLFIAPLAGFGVLAARQGIDIGREMAELKEFSPQALTAALSRWELVRAVIGEPRAVNAQFKSVIHSAGQLTTAALLKIGRNVPRFLLHSAVALLAFFFFLLDGERFIAWVLALGALDRDVQEQLVASFRDTTVAAVLAGLAAAASQAAIVTVGFIALAVPGAFLAGGVTFIFAWIPMLGTIPASVAGLLYLYVEEAPLRMSLMVGLALLAGTIDNLVRPLVLNGRADMHPLVGFVAIIGGLQMFGLLGVFIGPIAAALLISLLRIWPVIASRSGPPTTGP